MSYANVCPKCECGNLRLDTDHLDNTVWRCLECDYKGETLKTVTISNGKVVRRKVVLDERKVEEVELKFGAKTFKEFIWNMRN